AIAVSAEASVRSFEDIEWVVDSSRYDASLSWEYGQTMEFQFYQMAGRELVLRVSAPYVLRHAESARLYSVNSPLQKENRKILLDKKNHLMSGGSPSSAELLFDQDVNLLLDSMGKGGWGVLELTAEAGVKHSIEMPAIDFREKLEQFNVKRNKLPPLNWDLARKVDVFFVTSESRLDEQQQRKLNDLVEFIKFESEVVGITVDGHTDITGDRLKNLTLSEARAAAVRDFLTAAGIDEKLLSAVRFHGQRYPLPGVGHGLNRRVEIRLTRKSDVQTDSMEGT
ncbi:MAG: OmpA family protein, partial [Endozoicomonas sp.]